MAPTIYLTVGISGSGKSRFAKWLCKTKIAVELNADEVRKSFGDISSQKNEEEVWRKIDWDTIAHLAGGHSILLSNTNLQFHRIEFLHKKFPYNDIVLFLMKDSFDVDLCKRRVEDDINNGVERSNVPVSVIEKQSTEFINLYFKLKEKFENLELANKNIQVFVVDSTYAIHDFDEV